MQAVIKLSTKGLSRLRPAIAGRTALGTLLAAASSQAFAQPEAAPPSNQQTEAARPPSGQTDRQSPDIVVTAQRREQRLQDVPIAVSAYSQESLDTAGITSTTELTQITPSLNATQTAYFSQPTIRGVGTFNTHIGDEPNVATYVDGVYISQMIGSFYEFANIQQIEVLRGPQGTLFGRNATGGALNITTRPPTQTPEFEGSLTYGRFNQAEGSVYLAGGLAPGVAANFAGFYGHRDGIFTNTVLNGRREGERNNYVVRSRVLIEAAPNVSFTLTGDVARSDDPQGILTHTLNRNSVAELFGVNTSVRDYELQTPYSPVNIIEQQGASLIARAELDPFTIISTTAYRHTHQHAEYDADSAAPDLLYFEQNSDITDWMEELRLVSPAHRRVEWILGGFVFHSTSGYVPLIVSSGRNQPLLFGLETEQKTTALAAFADVTFHVTDTLALTGGVRYSDESKRYNFNIIGVVGGTRPKVDFTSWTPRAVLSWNVNPNVLLYGSYSRGFKSGGYNTSAPFDAPYLPEILDAFEIGAKTTLRRGVTLNLAAFHYNYRDLQVQSRAPGTGTARVTNAASARMDGVEAEFSAQLTRDFSLRVAAAYLHARYDVFDTASIFIPNVAGSPGAGNHTCVDRRATGGVNECDASGLQLPRAPDFTLSVGGNYRHVFPSGHSLRLSANGYYSASYPWDSGGLVSQSAYFLLNAQAEFSFPGDHFSIMLWGKNLTDERVYNFVSFNEIGDVSSFADPITYGVTARVRF